MITKAYANVSGLAKTLQRNGILENETDLKDFTIGFTNAMASFDVVDIGEEEQVDSKIKGKKKPCPLPCSTSY